MKFLNIVCCLILLSFRTSDQQVEVRAQLKLNTIPTPKLGLLKSLSLVVENTGTSKLYLQGVRNTGVKIQRKTKDGSFHDYFWDWLNREYRLPNREEIYKAVGETYNVREVHYDETFNSFEDPLAQDLYLSTLKGKVVRDRNDTLAIRYWVTSNFKTLIYLKPHELYNEEFSMNSLEKGSYRIFYVIDRLRDASYLADYYVVLHLVMPEKLNGHQKFQGTIKSDTIYLEVN